MVREGRVTFKYLADENLDLAFTRGDSTAPWRAEFAEGAVDGSRPTGWFETQHVDARFRDSILLSQIIDSDLSRLQATDIQRVKVTVGEFDGYRVTYTLGDGDGLQYFDQIALIDDRRSGVYSAAIGCAADCRDESNDEIDEILATFWVEP